jgi:hypothetical protein
MTAISRPVATQLAVVLGIVTALAYAGSASAAACDGVPQCEPQTQASIRYNPWETKGWAYYCTGDHPYYWNTAQVLGFGNNFSFNNKCFTVTENPFAENEPSKFDATITNFCLKHENITVTLGCSQQSTDVPCKNNTSKVVKDPNCPIVSGTQKNICNQGPVPACIQVWEEQCASGAVYCTADEAVIWCVTCGP